MEAGLFLGFTVTRVFTRLGFHGVKGADERFHGPGMKLYLV
jgi:hypothetical protein